MGPIWWWVFSTKHALTWQEIAQTGKLLDDNLDKSQTHSCFQFYDRFTIRHKRSFRLYKKQKPTRNTFHLPYHLRMEVNGRIHNLQRIIHLPAPALSYRISVVPPTENTFVGTCQTWGCFHAPVYFEVQPFRFLLNVNDIKIF